MPSRPWLSPNKRRRTTGNLLKATDGQQVESPPVLPSSNLLGPGQDAKGDVPGHMRQELEEQFERMIAAVVERSTEEKVAELSRHRHGKDGGSGSFDLGVLSGHFVRMNDLLSKNLLRVEGLMRENQENGEKLRQSIEGLAGKQSSALDMQRLSSHLDRIQAMMETSTEDRKDRARDIPDPQSQPTQIDLWPLTERLERVQEAVERNNDCMRQLLESQNASREAVEANGGEIDFTPLAELLDAIRESSDTNADTIKKLLDSQEATHRDSSVDFSPLVEHLEAIRNATEKNTEQIGVLVRSQQSSASMSGRSPDFDLTPLTERLNHIHSTLQKQSEQEVQSPGTGDGKFLMNALTSHLSKIQGVTEQNAQHVRALREKQSSGQDKMHVAVSETSEQVQALLKRNEENEARIEAQNSQMREMMSGEREMVDVVRELARGVVARNEGSCDHVVVPPPRKMGRKVVGFVYDAKDGMP